MNRREMMMGAGVAALAAMTKVSLADEHHHIHPDGNKNEKLIKASANCIQAGHRCIHHCLELLGQGDTEMAACAISVNQMLAICTAVEQLAGFDSKHLPKLARVAMDICKECETECRKHEQKHAECKACAEACAVCLEECQVVAGMTV
ncbi:conserved hypothetical protein [Gammaproteobacteria bacterium]